MRYIKALIFALAVILCLSGCAEKAEKSYYSVPKSEIVDSVPTSSGAVQSSDSGNVAETANIVYTTYKNSLFGYSIDVPDIMSGQGEKADATGQVFKSTDPKATLDVGGSYASSTQSSAIADIYNAEKGKISKTIGYEYLGSNYYVLSWENDNTIEYKKCFLCNDGSMNWFVLEYQKENKDVFADIVSRIEQSFAISADMKEATFETGDVVVNKYDDSAIFVRYEPQKASIYDYVLKISAGDTDTKLVFLGDTEVDSEGYTWLYVRTPFDGDGWVRSDIVVKE